MNRPCCVVETAGYSDWASGSRASGAVAVGAKDLRRELAVRRFWEGVIGTVVGGLILWLVTGSMSQPAATAERMAATAAPMTQPASQPAAIPDIASRATSATSEVAAPPANANLSVPAAIRGPALVPPPTRSPGPYFVPVGTVLMYENFSHYREGNVTDWGPNTFVKMGLDRRNWLVSNVEGTHAVGCRIRLPNEFYFECRYSAYMPEVTRGILGWWKEPVSTRISFLNDHGVQYAIQWVVKCGNDPTRLNPLGSSSPFAKKYYHTINLPDGTANELAVMQPTGTLRIDRNGNVLTVLVDGQTAVVGTMSLMGQLVGFQIDVVKAKNGELFFTDFKVAR